MKTWEIRDEFKNCQCGEIKRLSPHPSWCGEWTASRIAMRGAVLTGEGSSGRGKLHVGENALEKKVSGWRRNFQLLPTQRLIHEGSI